MQDNITGIVILNYNNYLDTIDCIKSIYATHDKENYVLVLVDNGSTNDSVVQIELFLNSLNDFISVEEGEIGELKSNDNVFVKATKNYGYAKGNNLGIDYLVELELDYIMVLNNDTRFKTEVLSGLQEQLETNEDLGLISPLIVKEDCSIDYNCCRKKTNLYYMVLESITPKILPSFIKNKRFLLKNNPKLIKEKLIYPDLISGCLMMGKTEVWKNVKGFDPNTFLYYEENILEKKLSKLKLKVAVFPSLELIHLGAKSTSSVKNVNLLQIELESIEYFLKEYTKVNLVFIKVVIGLKRFKIDVIKLKNKFFN